MPTSETNNIMTKMDEHISDDDLFDYFEKDCFDDDFKKMTARINLHIRSCSLCRGKYDAIKEASESLDKISSYLPRKNRFQVNLIRWIYLYENQKDKEGKKLVECVERVKELTFSVLLKIKNFNELGWVSLSGQNEFYHPAFAAVGKSTEGRPSNGVIKSIIVDGNNGRITIGIDRTLSLYFDKNDCTPGNMVILIPADAEAEPYFKFVDKYGDDMVVARFDDINPGDYIVAFKE